LNARIKNPDLREAFAEFFSSCSEEAGESLAALAESAAGRKVIKKADASRSARRNQSKFSVIGFNSVSECLAGFGFV
jgi:histone H3/H4